MSMKKLTLAIRTNPIKHPKAKEKLKLNQTLKILLSLHLTRTKNNHINKNRVKAGKTNSLLKIKSSTIST